MAENKFNNVETIARRVPMGRLQSVIGGKWKILILWYVSFSLSLYLLQQRKFCCIILYIHHMKFQPHSMYILFRLLHY